MGLVIWNVHIGGCPDRYVDGNGMLYSMSDGEMDNACMHMKREYH
jgi:hypothetical protein